MPVKNDSITCLVIKVTLTGPTPSFDVQAGGTPTDPGLLPYFCNGSKDADDATFFKEILGKIIASYPSKPISLCLDDPVILPDARCAPVKVPVRRAAPKAAAPKAAPRKKAVEAKAPRAESKAKSRRKSTKKRS